MLIAGHQPEYLPYIGFFNKMMLCDQFVIVDHVQFNKKTWQNRNRISTAQGELMLTIPVLSKGSFEQAISEVRVNNNEKWRKKNWQSILLNYKKAPFFDEHKYFFEDIYSKNWEKLVDLNESIIRYIAEQLKITTPVVKSSEMNALGQKTDLLISLCKNLKADAYLSGAGGHDYVDDQQMKAEGIQSKYTDFKHPVYKQLHEPFMPNMSIIDLLFNRGKEESRQIVKQSGGISQ